MTSGKEYIKKITEILEERGKEWPLRGKYWHLFNEESGKFYSFLKKNINKENDNEIKKKISPYCKIEKNPIFICGNLKSGTTLLTQLLDNHKNIFVLPGDSFFAKKFYNSKETVDKIGLYWLKRLLNPTGQAPFLAFGKSEIIYQNFIKYLHFLINKEKKDIFTSVILSFAAAVHNNKKNELIYWAEKTPLNELYVEKLSKLYPDAKFLNIVRDPVQNVVSLKRLDKVRNRKFNILRQSLFQVFLIKHTEKNIRNIKNYKITAYEELIKNTEKSMKDIAKFLNIEFCETLMKPTINGIPASANSMGASKRLQGKIVKSTNNPEKLNELNKKERIILVNSLSIHKPYRNLINQEYPELIKHFNPFFYLSAKITFILYKIYRKIFK